MNDNEEKSKEKNEQRRKKNDLVSTEQLSNTKGRKRTANEVTSLARKSSTSLFERMLIDAINSSLSQ